MTRRAVLLGLMAFLPACGPEAVAQAELGEVCGGPSPFRVLELEPDEVLMSDRPLRVHDRVLYVVSRRGEDEPDATFPRTVESTVWATGPCGESPVQVATGIDSLFTLEIWPDIALGCEEATGRVVVLDPTGVDAPHAVFPELSARFGCALRWTPHGVLSVDEHDENLGALLLHPYPADPRTETSEPVVLLDPIRLGPSNSSGTGIIGDVLYTYEDFVLALTPDDTLVRVDLADGAVTSLQTDVAVIEASREGRYVLWQDTTVTVDDPRYPGGRIFLRDLSTGTDAFLYETALAFSMFPMTWADHGLVQLGLGYVDRDPKRMFFLPELDHVDVSPALFLNARLDDDRWLGSSTWGNRYELIDLRRGEYTRLFDRDADILHLDRDADILELLEMPQCCIEGDFRDEGPIWRVPLDGSTPQRLARRASRKTYRLADGRFLSTVDLDAGWLGPLVILEPDTEAELRVDDHVFAFSIDRSRADDDGIITYSVSDGDRSGVYLAQLPPGDRSASSPRRASDEAFVVDLVRAADGRPTPSPRSVQTRP